MLESGPICVLVGTVLGLLSGLGVGGGSLLILWLTAVLGMEHSMARGINLLFFLPCAAASSILRRKQGQIEMRILLPAILAGCAAAAAGSWLSMYLELALVKKLFGGLLLFTGARELLYRPKKQAGNS